MKPYYNHSYTRTYVRYHRDTGRYVPCACRHCPDCLGCEPQTVERKVGHYEPSPCLYGLHRCYLERQVANGGL